MARKKTTKRTSSTRKKAATSKTSKGKKAPARRKATTRKKTPTRKKTTSSTKKTKRKKGAPERGVEKTVLDGIPKDELEKAVELIMKMSAPTEDCLRTARRVVVDRILGPSVADVTLADRLLFILSWTVSVRHMPGYATLDPKHVAQIRAFTTNIEAYVDDKSRQRPLNFLMLASPGAGKSHFIKCVGRSLASRNIQAIDFNMATLQTNEDFIPALDGARNAKVDENLPLLFLDEFDSDERNFPLLLPLLWDGELNLGQRNLRIGKAVIVLAGSDPKLPIVMNHARSMRRDMPETLGNSSKIVDLCSRINGTVIELPKFFEPSQSIDRRADKICITTQLLWNRFGPSLRNVSVGLLRFIARVEFRYNVRSIAHLIEEIPHKEGLETLRVKDAKLPLSSTEELEDSSLAYHLLHHHQSHGIVEEWKECGKIESVVPVRTRAQERLRFYGDVPRHIAGWLVSELAQELSEF